MLLIFLIIFRLRRTTFSFEKMISGLYMGELVRLIMVKFVNENLLFRGQGSELLSTRDTFKTEHVCEIESDKPGEFDKCRDILEANFEIEWASDQDCDSVRFICEKVSKRSAHLVSACIATLINKMDEKSVTVRK